MLVVSPAVAAEPTGNNNGIVSSLTGFVDGIASFFDGNLFSLVAPSSVQDDHKPSVDECDVNNEGDIIGGCNVWPEHIRDEYDGDWERGDTFKVVIKGIDPTGDTHAPQTYYLYRNGYIASGVDSEDRNDFSQLHINHGDLEWNSQLQSSLKQGSTCSMRMDLGSTGGFNFKYRKNGEIRSVEYNDEPDWDQEPADSLMDPVTVQAHDVEVFETVTVCQFKVEDVLDHNEHGGEFVSWDGRYPTFSVGNDGGSLSNVNVDYNAAPTLDSVDAPETVQVGEPATISVSASDADGDSLTYTWSNEIRGESAAFTFDTTGEKTVSVNVSDGKSTVQREVVIEVVSENKPPRNVHIDVPGQVTAGETVTLTASASDPEGDSLTYTWSNGATGKSVDYTFSSAGEQTITVEVSDGTSSVEQSATVFVAEDSTDGTGETENPDSPELGPVEQVFYSVIGFFGGLI